MSQKEVLQSSDSGEIKEVEVVKDTKTENKEFNLSEQLQRVVNEKIENFKKEYKTEFELAQKQLEEAKVNKLLEDEIKTNTFFQTREQTKDRLKKELIKSFEDLNNMVERGQYFSDLFLATNYRDEWKRKLCYAAKVLGPEKMVEKFITNLDDKSFKFQIFK